jgi:hypothetical protein
MILEDFKRPTVWLTCRWFEQDKIAQNHFFYQMAAADRAPQAVR